MNAIKRIKAVKAMEFLARCCNDESNVDIWLIDGVADGDIKFGDLDILPDDEENLDYYIKDNSTFADIMDTFLYVMKKAYKDGGLYVDGVVSKPLQS